MKQVKYLIFTLVCTFIFPMISHGECNYQRQAELSRIASNVKINYNYTLNETNNLQFVINITNLTDDIYLKQDDLNIITGTGEKQINVGYASSIKYDIYSNDSSCKDEFLLTKYITIPTVNTLADTDLCKNNSNFKYCQRWGNYSISYNELLNQFNLYKKNLEKKSDSKNNTFQILIDYFNNNKFMIAFFGIVILCTIIYYIFNKKKM